MLLIYHIRSNKSGGGGRGIGGITLHLIGGGVELKCQLLGESGMTWTALDSSSFCIGESGHLWNTAEQ